MDRGTELYTVRARRLHVPKVRMTVHETRVQLYGIGSWGKGGRIMLRVLLHTALNNV